jgi:hypothetical protein
MFETIVSVHTPKAAGSSFLHQLKGIYGEHNLLLDYKDDPVNPLSIVNIDPDLYDVDPIKSIAPYKVVHGHFHPYKYGHLENAFRMTFLRHPIDNVMSIYYFWMAHDRECWDSPVFQYYKDANLSLTRFAMLPKIRYLYSRFYFGDFYMSHFDFIGDYAKYDEELVRLGKCLGVQFDLTVRLNITLEYSKVPSNLDNEREIDTKAIYDNLAEILKDDIDFYEQHKGR